MKNKVVITGCGIVSAIGNNKQQCLASLLQGRSGVGKMRYLDSTHLEFPVGEVKMSNEEMKQLLGLNKQDCYSRTELMGIIAMKEALMEAHLGNIPVALFSGTTVGGMDLTEQAYPDNLTAELLGQHDCGSCTDKVADYFGQFDSIATISTACSSTTNAIILGTRLINSGKRDVVVVGGCEGLTRFHLNGFKSLMILDEELCKPFDANRKGLNLGEGAAYLVLESERFAKKRGARIIAEVKGCGNVCDAYHQTASSPTGEGAFLAMRQALKEAGLGPEDIQYINAHGTGTPNNDASESVALKRVFGERLPMISSTKGFTGHTTSVSGVIECVFCLLALQNQFVPANIGFKQVDADCIVPVQGNMAIVPKTTLVNVLCNGFGFGGNDSTVLLGCYRPSHVIPNTVTEEHHVYIVAQVEDVPESEYRQYVNPLKTRRYGRLLKRALVTALKAIQESGIEHPDAIINGTALGCLKESEYLLDGLATEGESISVPTHFMQSTHNTIASLIGIHTKTHSYNCTYSQRKISFECALFDAFLQMKEGLIKTALVCVNDEITSGFQQKLDVLGITDSVGTDCSKCWMLSTEPGVHPIAEITSVDIFHAIGQEDRSEIKYRKICD